MKQVSAYVLMLFGAFVSAQANQNVILILADDMSPHLSMLGTPGIETPNIDALAAEGVYFENAFAASASCSPSRTAILTGMWPHSNGNWRNVHTPKLSMPDRAFSRQTDVRDRVGISDSIPSLPELLKRDGFFTAITQKLHLSPAWRYPYDARDPVQSDPERFNRLIKSFIEQAGDSPFFIHANIAAPHRPYRAHLKQNPQQRLPEADGIAIPPFLPDTPGVRRDLQEYYACVEIVDACVGAILEAMDDMGVREDTLIIFTSDQGMPIHHAKASAYPGGIRIPLVVAGPGVDPGRTVTAPVSQVDYAPTILEYCDVRVPSRMQGISLWPILEGADDLTGRRYVFAEHNSHGPDPREYFPQRVVTDGEWYYILNLDPDKAQRLPDDLRGVEVWGNHAYQSILSAREDYPFQAWFLTRFAQPREPEHLYFIATDPWGVNDLATHPSTEQKLKELRKVMERWRKDTDDINRSPSEIPPHQSRS